MFFFFKFLVGTGQRGKAYFRKTNSFIKFWEQQGCCTPSQVLGVGIQLSHPGQSRYFVVVVFSPKRNVSFLRTFETDLVVVNKLLLLTCKHDSLGFSISF